MEEEKSVFITGASGFVGSNLVSYLAKKFALVTSKVRYLPEQVFDLKGSFAVVHLAGKAHDLKNVSVPQEYYEVNYELTKQLYDAFIASQSAKFIFVSSVKAVADHADGPVTEEQEPHPKNHYGKSKRLAEEYIEAQSLPPGKSYYILRPCMIHGPGNKGNLNLLYKFVSKGLPYPLAAFSNKRSFLSVENLCFVIKEILERDNIPSGIYNVADDEALSTNEIVSILAGSLNKKPWLLKIPVRLVSLIAKMGDKLRLPLNSDRLQKLTENYVVSNKKIKTALHKELPVGARDGILTTTAFFVNK
ncbi:MAG: NAD-dependent epimerase/dehydratase family protein [Sediminibacterium sp.]